MLALFLSQFHYGSIKTLFDMGEIGEEKCLNSTMVRLKLRIDKDRNYNSNSLNSTMVRLKPTISRKLKHD